MASAGLDYITVKGFKSFASLEKLRLAAINVVMGPNGSGKSNFVGVFSFLNSIQEGKLQEYVTKAGGAEKVLHFGSKTTSLIEILVSFGNEVNRYQLRLTSVGGDQLAPSGETVYFWDKENHPDRPYREGLHPNGLEAGISRPECEGIAQHVRHHLQSWQRYDFHDTSVSSPMKKTASLNDNRFLRPDGSNLAAFLYLLREKHRDSYGLIRGAVQRVATFFDDFQLEPMRLKPDSILLEWRHKGSDS